MDKNLLDLKYRVFTVRSVKLKIIYFLHSTSTEGINSVMLFIIFTVIHCVRNADFLFLTHITSFFWFSVTV